MCKMWKFVNFIWLNVMIVTGSHVQGTQEESIARDERNTGPGCRFPSTWEGEYFHLGHTHPLVVTNNSISEKGVCVWSSGDKYVLRHMTEVRGGGKKRCWRCLKMYRKHSNVLLYKESHCETDKTYIRSYDDLCDAIFGHFGHSPTYELQTMIRRSGTPEPCPFHGLHTFSYARGGTEPMCNYPYSYLDSYKNYTQLHLNYQACPNVPGSEAVLKQLTCLAGWQDGSRHYLVGAVDGPQEYTDEQRYRCFVWYVDQMYYIRMAESASATCKGLWSPYKGHRLYEIEKDVTFRKETGMKYPIYYVPYEYDRSYLISKILEHIVSKLDNFP